MSRSRLRGVVTLVLSLVAGLTLGLPPVPVAASPSTLDAEIPVRSLASQVTPLPPMAKHVSRPVVWPSAGSAVVRLPVVEGRRATASAIIGGLPVTFSPVPVDEITGELPSSPLAMKVEVLDRAAAEKAGVPLALRLSRADGGSGPAKVNVGLDYNRFRDAYGGAWAARLGLMQVPECGMSAVPADRALLGECVGRALVSINNFKAARLSADVDLAAPLKTLSARALSERERALIGIEAPEPAVSTSAPSGVSFVVLTSAGNADGVGTFNKTDLKASYAWNAGANTGNFTFSYPMTVPPVPGGLTPDLGLDYSSQAVDGQTAGENIQSGLVGEGWSLSAGGYIESTFRSCGEDQDHAPHWPQRFDTCVRFENFQLAWGANSGELVPAGDGTRNVWVPAGDDGLKAEQVTSGLGGTVQPYWKVTTKDGTQWFFGRQRLPGWTPGARETNSTLSQQVWANHSDEPCFDSGSFYHSHCLTVYRWNLDYVVDVHGNSMSYWYERSANLHGSNGNGWNEKWYERDAVLSRIEYGTRAGNETTATAPAVVKFDNVDRCVQQPCRVNGAPNTANWPDTPWDLQCTVSPCQRLRYGSSSEYVPVMGPTYWTDKRLSKINTHVFVDGFYKRVDEWALGQSFTGDTDVPVLWLDSVTRTGFDLNDRATALPPLTTHGFVANNRADYDPAAGMALPNKTRIDAIDTETGGRIAVSYRPRDEPACVWSVGKPDSAWPDHNHNPSRCFQQYTTNRYGEPGHTWWHKFVVSKVTQSDLVGGSPPVETSYSYSMEGATSPSGHPLVLWSYASNPWGTIHKTMSTWRGYPTVITAVGPADGVRTRTKRLYYRGLDRDTGLDAGQGQEFFRRASITDSTTTTVEDHQALAGQVREETVYNGPAEEDAISRTIHDFSVTHTQGSGLPSWQTPPERKAYRTRETSSRQRTKLVGTPDWRDTEVKSTFDNWGSLATLNDLGDIGEGTPADEVCTRFDYVRNTNDLRLRVGSGSGLVVRSAAATSAASDLSAYDLVFPAGGDFTGDGRKDLIARNSLNTHLYVLAGNDNGTFAAPARFGLFWGAGPVVFSAGDWSGDGKPDVLFRNESNMDLYMVRGNGNGGWLTGAVEGPFGNDWIDDSVFSPGDISGDGKPDIMFRRISDGKLMYVRGNGTGGWVDGATLVADGGDWRDRDRIFGRGDATGDGRTDIYARVAATGELRLYPGNGNGTFGAPVSLGTGWGDYTKLLTAGDVNTDGKLDVLGVQGGGYLPDVRARSWSAGMDCGTQTAWPHKLISDVRTSFDNRGYGEPAVRGLGTRTETVKSFSGQNVTEFVVTTAGHDQWGRPVSATDGLGHQTTTEYLHSPAGLLSSIKVTNPKSHVVSTTLDPLRGQPLTITDANGKATTGVYDRLGRLTKVVKPGNTTAFGDVEYAYSITKSAPPHVATKVLGPNGNQITSYDILDGLLRPRQTQTVTEAGKSFVVDTRYDVRGLTARTSRFSYAAAGPTSQLVPFNDADVEVQNRLEYDWAGRQTEDELWKANVFQWQTQTVYGGDRTGVIPPTGGTPTQEVFDARGRVIEKQQFSGTPFTGAFLKTTYGYDDAGRLTTVKDPASNAWTYEYDLLGRKTKTTDPDAGSSTSTYDNAGRLTSTTDARSQTLVFEYDSLGRKTKERDTTPTGTVLAEWTYDTYFKGQLAESVRWVGADAYKTRISDRDDSYRPKHTQVDIPNTTLNPSLAGSYVWQYTYKPNGAAATTTLPAAGDLPAETLTYTYDNNGFAQTMTGTWQSGSQTYVNDTNYHYDGLVNRRYLGNTGKRVYVETAFEAAGRRLSTMNINAETAGTPGQYGADEFSFTHEYASSGLIKGIAGSANEAADQKECFSYDYLTRLTEAWTQTSGACATPQRTGADPYWRQWTFDAVGNRLTQEDKDPMAGDTTWTHVVGVAGSVKPHQLKTVTAAGPKVDTPTRTFGYDLAGNTISAVTTTGLAQTLTWDREGHLATVVQGSSTSGYLYDADGRRLMVRTPEKTTLYLPDGTELEKLASGGPVLANRYYADLAVRSIGGLKWLCGNHQGTATIQIDSVTLSSAQRRAMPYGEDRTATPAGWTGTKGYVGGTRDTNTYTHLGAREYDPTLGRFISVDPVMDLTDPDQWHAYAYSHNNPVTFSDPTGLMTKVDGGGGGLGPAPKKKLTPHVQQIKRPTFDNPILAGIDSVINGMYDVTAGGIIEYGRFLGEETERGVNRWSNVFSGEWSLGQAWDDYMNNTLPHQPMPWDNAVAVGQLASMTVNAQVALVQGDLKTAAQNYGYLAGIAAGTALTGRAGRFGKFGCHSFAPATPVLMANGASKPIAEIALGDLVLATDPDTGETTPKQVTQLHLNDDWDLAEVDIRDDATGRTTTLETTWHHPFWNATDDRWTDAADLTPGTRLRDDEGKETQQVVAVRTWTGLRQMRDLTVADLHTYYVVAGITPVLVHNCGNAQAYRDVPDPLPQYKPTGGRNRNSAAFINVRDRNGKVTTVGSTHGEGGLHAEDVAQRLVPGGQMSRPFGWRADPFTQRVTWQPINVCPRCQLNYPPTLFPPGTRADSPGAWGQ